MLTDAATITGHLKYWASQNMKKWHFVSGVERVNKESKWCHVYLLRREEESFCWFLVDSLFRLSFSVPCKALFDAWIYSMRGYIPHVDILRACMAIFHAWLYVLHETCMFHAIRKRGPRKHVTGYIGFHVWLHAW